MLICDIIAEAAKIFYVTQEELTGPSRKKMYTKPRFALMKALHLRGWSTARIGRQMAKDHTTVMYGLERANALMLEDGRFRLRVEYLANLESGEALSPAAGPDMEESARIDRMVGHRMLVRSLDTSNIPDRKIEEKSPWEHEMAPKGWGAEKWVRIHYHENAVGEACHKMLERILATGKMWIPAQRKVA